MTKCQAVNCQHGADYRDDSGLLMCALHARVRCACGRWMLERYAADGEDCDTCMNERPYKEANW